MFIFLKLWAIQFAQKKKKKGDRVDILNKGN